MQLEDFRFNIGDGWDEYSIPAGNGFRAHLSSSKGFFEIALLASAHTNMVNLLLIRVRHPREQPIQPLEIAWCVYDQRLEFDPLVLRAIALEWAAEAEKL